MVAVLETALHVGEPVAAVAGYTWVDGRRAVPPGVRSSNGVGVWTREGMMAEVLATNERVVWLRLPGGRLRTTFIAFIYAPVEAHARRDEAVEFWRALGDQAAEFSDRGDVVVMGDCNGRVGDVVGDSTTNSNGGLLLSFCASHNFVVVNAEQAYGEKTFAPSGRGVSTVDYVLVQQQAMHRVHAMSVDDAAHISDHRALRLSWRASAGSRQGLASGSSSGSSSSGSSSSKNQQPRWRLPRVDAEWERYTATAGEGARHWLGRHTRVRADERPAERVERMWHSFSDTVVTAADACFARRTSGGGGGRRSSSDPEVKQWMAERAALLQQFRTADASLVDEERATAPDRWRAYAELRRRVTQQLRQRRRARERQTFASLQELEGDPRAFHTRMRSVAGRGRVGGVPVSMRGKDGQPQTREESELAWLRHFAATGREVEGANECYDGAWHQHVVNAVEEAAAGGGRPVVPLSSELGDALTEEEVEKALGSMKRGKSRGEDGIVAELLQRGGTAMVRALHALLSVIFTNELVPQQWLMALVVPIYKGVGSRLAVDNWRPIALLAVVSKLYEKVLETRLVAWLARQRAIPDEQGAFQRGKGCMEQVFVLGEIVAQRREQQLPTYLCFLDISKAYDRCWRDGLWYRLLHAGVHGKMWRVLRDLYRAVRSRIIVNDRITPAFDTDLGVRQGAVLSPALFSLFMSEVVEEWRRLGIGVKIGSRTIAGLLYADDVVLIADSIEQLHVALGVMEQHARRWRYRFNASKCVVVAMRQRKPTDEAWRLGGEAVAEQRSYKYLGVHIASNSGWQQWHDARLRRGQGVLPTLWWCGARHGALALATSDKLVRMLLAPTVGYGGELAATTAAQQQAIERLQVIAGCQLLGLPRRGTTHDMVRGELGWATLESRRHSSQLLFLCKLQRMAAGLVKDVFVARYSSFVGRAAAGRSSLGFLPNVAVVLRRYGLQAHMGWRPTVSKAGWRRAVMAAVDRVQQREWRARLQTAAATGRGKAPWYCSVKPEWGRERYLDATSRVAVLGNKWRARCRCLSGLPLLSEQLIIGRVKSAVCVLCESGEVEDVTHVMCTCPCYAAGRTALFSEMGAVWAEARQQQHAWWRREAMQWDDMTAVQRAQWLLRCDDEHVSFTVSVYLYRLFRTRAAAVAEAGAVACGQQ